MDTFNLSYSYSTRDEKKLEPFLCKLEQDLGGERDPYFMRAGALDLVTILEIIASITVLVPVAKYFEGLLFGDKAQALGEKHRREIETWFSRLSSDVKRVVQVAQVGLEASLINIPKSDTSEAAIAIVIPVNSIPLYAVLNHTDMSLDLWRDLPGGLIRALQFLSEHSVPEDSISLQLFYDKAVRRWRYLLAPTPQMFGRWVDRYVDLDSQQIRFVESRQQFFEIFRPESHDEYKFLISPFRET